MNASIGHCPPDSLIEAPAQDSPAWDVVSGSVKHEYFTQSPYATIEAYAKGFVVHNLVTGGQHPVATWAQAIDIRLQLSGRYQSIARGGY